MFRESLEGLAGTEEGKLWYGLRSLIFRQSLPPPRNGLGLASLGRRGDGHLRMHSAYSDISEADTLVDPRDGDAARFGLAMKRFDDEREDGEVEMAEVGRASLASPGRGSSGGAEGGGRRGWTLRQLLGQKAVRIANSALFLNS